MGRSGGATPGGVAGLTHGPFIGDVTSTGARVWARCSVPGVYTLTTSPITADAITPDAGLTSRAVARPERDLCVEWRLHGLRAGTRYRYDVTYRERRVFRRDDACFGTPGQDPTVTRLVMGSCAREDTGSAAVWRRMATHDPDAVVLLGDTPYIDSTDLHVQRARRAEFAAMPDLAALLRSRPLYATWDDHDFGANDSTGRLPGRERSRQAFLEYHANPSYGNGADGIYTKFRMGSVEVFLLHTRYFAATEPSPIDGGRPTLLGAEQWNWLRDELRASTAPFKVLASGMVWNGAVRPNKQDHWGTYSHEREALFRFIGREAISGVVLVGGDVHRTRVLRHDTVDSVGYPLIELTTSPIHDGVIPEANAPHPALVHDAGEPHSFLLLTVDGTVTPATLTARFENAEGRRLFSLTTTLAELSAT